MVNEIAQVKVKNTFLSRVYGWMTLALVISGVTAFLAATNETIIRLTIGNGFGFLILAVAELALVWWLTASIHKISSGAAFFAFILYSVLNGVTLSSVFLVYKIESIFMVFFISAGMFAAMAVYGTVTKSSLSSFGKYFAMALVGIIIASLVNFLLRSPMLDWFLSIITVVLFTGLTAYDAQKMLAVSNNASDDEVFKKASVIGALELYLDFINIFLAMLRLFGRRRD
ncbi:MAG: Bax inhibitor-1/YccA family protein [Treponema porcinum]|uniref:Bax inhibitor-1/YccA family protein n=1 Tax=Treponema porcinum TaxID=261392 RepID=UPI0023527F11|nr:Bax inhibitor-1/YccA family protein [Treponema porcinum]MCI6180307.1 Bax inhibitor-1/YccA family protein [Treponema porcinum]MCI6722282.1 Bax inhibitor-1/YccA family protein [Treponema porcinum]MCI6815841.1 Bax inhibitor-1/YccA family protein [Treponema porcinum]MCI6983951.1 Bax inhibitor-1/YccA family protein [Treponema porcinum]MCI7080519.1 Bax inhibitor-1/YccA family protein [Treponema porcinum]